MDHGNLRGSRTEITGGVSAYEEGLTISGQLRALRGSDHGRRVCGAAEDPERERERESPRSRRAGELRTSRIRRDCHRWSGETAGSTVG